MAEPALMPVGQGAGTYVCTTCTNRVYTFQPQPLPPCTVCGGGEWRVISDGARAPATRF